jgi:hypothetical protein
MTFVGMMAMMDHRVRRWSQRAQCREAGISVKMITEIMVSLPSR